VPEKVGSLMSRLEAFELGPFTTRKTPIAITRMSTVNPSDIVGGRGDLFCTAVLLFSFAMVHLVRYRESI
jgi:hypothetical protein